MPARKRQNEKKFKGTALTRVVLPQLLENAKLLENWLDYRDIIGALNKALPKELRSKSKKPQDILLNVIKHYDQLDMGEAIAQLYQEMGEDKIGKIGDILKSKIASKNGWFKTKLFLQARF